MNPALRMLALFLIGIVMVCPSAALADSLNIVTVEESPYGYVVKGKSAGMLFQLSNVIAEQAGFSPRNSVVSLDTALRKLKSGTADMAIMFSGDKADAVADQVMEVFPVQTVVMVRADTVLRTLRDLAGKRVAAVRGVAYDKHHVRKEGISVIPAENCSQALKLLLSHSVDGVIGPGPALTFAIETNRLPKRALGKSLPLSVESVSLFVSHEVDNRLRERLVKAVSALEKDGRLTALVEKYSF